MSQAVAATITDYFAEVEDPRIDRTKDHELLDILVIAICGVICGGDGWAGIETFGNAKLDWLETFLDLPNGIPSHDTFGRVFARLDPESLQRCFIKWVKAVQEVTDGQVIAIDGKCLRHSFDTWTAKSAIHMVSAWASQNHMVLGQRKVDDKSNEITAIPALLELLEISNCIVTIDAIGCQKDIAENIVDQGAEYMLAVKANQPHLYEDIQKLFLWADNIEFAHISHDIYREVDKGHGRIEIRECWTISDPDYLAMIANHTEWKGLQTVIRVRAKRLMDIETKEETRYYISTLSEETPQLAQKAARAVRGHWSIENELHWVLDIAFQEDDSRIRQGHAAENMAVLRHIALNLLKRETSHQIGIKNKRLTAGWNNEYLEKVLSI
mgnify:FL=1